MKCIICKKIKNKEEFYIYKNGKIYSECKECKKENARNWNEKNKERHSKNKREYYKNNPMERLRQRAKRLARSAIKKGRIKKMPCFICKNNNLNELEAHHPDYNYPLNIIWVCKRGINDCHVIMDKKRKDDSLTLVNK